MLKGTSVMINSYVLPFLALKKYLSLDKNAFLNFTACVSFSLLLRNIFPVDPFGSDMNRTIDESHFVTCILISKYGCHYGLV